MMTELFGTGVALVTPFNANLSIDFEALGKILTHVTNGGVNYLVVCGTTGESATLSDEEKKSLLEYVKSNNREDLPVVFGIGGNNTRSCLESIEKTDFTGITALLSVSPYYNKPSQGGIIDHFTAIADQCPVPVILYNVPGRTSSNLSWETTVELAQHPNIVGIKEASGDLVQCMQIQRHTSVDFALISGDDLLTGVILSLGGVGVISVLANAFPKHFHTIIEFSKSAEYQLLNTELSKFLALNPLLYSEGNPVGIKEVLHQKGLCNGYVRLPLKETSDTLKNAISQALKNIEV